MSINTPSDHRFTPSPTVVEQHRSDESELPLLDALSGPPGTEDIEFDSPRLGIKFKPADLD